MGGRVKTRTVLRRATFAAKRLRCLYVDGVLRRLVVLHLLDSDGTSETKWGGPPLDGSEVHVGYPGRVTHYPAARERFL